MMSERKLCHCLFFAWLSVSPSTRILNLVSNTFATMTLFFWGVGGGQKTLLTFSDESVLLKVLRVREKSAALQNGGILK